MADDPFQGIPLSEQAGTKKLDQRLFTAAPAAAPPTPTPSKPAYPERPKVPAPSSAPPAQPKPIASPKVAAPAAPRFDLADPPFYKACFLFTQPELEALEDLKLELRRQLDTKVTKNDLARCALHLLLEDHAANGERSYARRKVRKR